MSTNGLENKAVSIMGAKNAISNACEEVARREGAKLVPSSDRSVEAIVIVTEARPPFDTDERGVALDWLREAAGAFETKAGVIAVVVPELGLAGVRGTVPAAASAGALIAATRALAIDRAPTVRANVVAYGCIEGDPYSDWLREKDPNGMIATDGHLTVLERYGRPEDVGRTVGFMISDRASFVTGHQLVVDGGYLVS